MYRFVRRPLRTIRKIIQINYFFLNKRFRANHYCSMTCLHNHDQILEFLRKIFLKGFQIYQNYLCALNVRKNTGVVLQKFLSPLAHSGKLSTKLMKNTCLNDILLAPERKRKKLFVVLKDMSTIDLYTFSLPNSGNCYFLVFQNACPNLTFTCPGQAGKCLYNVVAPCSCMPLTVFIFPRQLASPNSQSELI